MATNNSNDFDWASVPLPTDVAVKNYGASDIPALSPVKIDTANVLSGTNESIGVVLAGTADRPFGITVDDGPAGKQMRVRTQGLIPCIADTAISAGALLGPGYSGDGIGRVTNQASTNPIIGQAITAAGALGDTILLQLRLN